MREVTSAYIILVRKLEGGRTFRRRRHRGVDNIKMDLTEIMLWKWWLDSTISVQGPVMDLMNAEMNLPVS